MSILPLLLSNSDKSPWVPVERRNIRRRPHQAASAALHVARDYAPVGLPAFPLRPGEKNPSTPYGTDDATTNTTPIRAWWTRWTTVNHHRKRTEVGGRIRVARACASVLVSGGAS